MDSVIPQRSRIENLSDKHCVFCCGDAIFAIPATTVREVTIMPTIARVPLSHPSLSGIGNLRSEFLPVIDLEPIVGNQARRKTTIGQLIVIENQLGDWSIAIDKVIAIDGIETHIDATQRSDETTNFMLGTATYQGKVISVLDVHGLQRIAQQTLESQWASSDSPWSVSSPAVSGM
ncbi:chemotaxis protein CheW [Roseiconus lacunae]|uniref:Chemotaxis protein CheW n=1 Tax=Roseiconus lacunae TaxID=2605694 RepID=A0ABT7PLR6_9BACT|nr:chemotaxis protein CheW [Roseiconus lacunae]MCD0458103.1 chemotaxis protein CheW [Roseiconus lacunae]MDM4017457.1 chemotaxis protein CheW [Roseiconus lacunae]